MVKGWTKSKKMHELYTRMIYYKGLKSIKNASKKKNMFKENRGADSMYGGICSKTVEKKKKQKRDSWA